MIDVRFHHQQERLFVIGSCWRGAKLRRFSVEVKRGC